MPTSIPWFTLRTEAWHVQPAASSTTSTLSSILYLLHAVIVSVKYDEKIVLMCVCVSG